jgi:hypothetical protein
MEFDFDKEFRALCANFKEVLNNFNETQLSSNTIFLDALNNYLIVYDKTQPEDHIGYFDELMIENRAAIMRSPSALMNRELKIDLTDKKSDKSKKRKVFINITAIYRTASRIADEASERLEGLPITLRHECKELYYCDIVVLHLYRIFRHCASKREDEELFKKLDMTVTELENKLRGKRPQTNTMSGPLAPVMSMIQNMLNDNNIQLPKQLKDINASQIQSFINSMCDNPKTKETITSVFDKMKNSESLTEAISTLGKQFSNKELLETLATPSVPSDNEEGEKTEEQIKAEIERRTKTIEAMRNQLPDFSELVDHPERLVSKLNEALAVVSSTFKGEETKEGEVSQGSVRE